MIVYAPLPRSYVWSQHTLRSFMPMWNYKCIARTAQQAMHNAVLYHKFVNPGVVYDDVSHHARPFIIERVS